MNLYATHAQSLRKVMDSLKDASGTSVCPVVTWGGKTRKVIPTSAVGQKQLQPGGFNFDNDFKFETVTSAFTDLESETPEQIRAKMLETKLTYQGEEFKIVVVKIRPGGLQIEVGCDALNKMNK